MHWYLSLKLQFPSILGGNAPCLAGFIVKQTQDTTAPASLRPVISIDDLTISVPNAGKSIVRNVFLRIRPGECHILRGPTGSGKSSLLKALADQLPPDWVHGKIEVNEPYPAVILQNPETQLLSPTIGGECAFGLENLGWAVPAMEEMVDRALSAVGLHLPWNTPTRSLSMGQKYKLLIAAFLVRQCRLFILDEPGTQLDRAGRQQLAGCLLDRKAAGCAILLCEQSPAELADIADYIWSLNKGRIIPEPSVTPSALPPPPQGKTSKPESSAVIEAQNLQVQGAPGIPLIRNASFVLHQGQFLLITGPNGSGKSSLINCLAGFRNTMAGRLHVLGSPPKPSRLQGILGLILQNPERQFFEISVEQELRFGLQRLGSDRDVQETLCAHQMERFGLSSLSTLPPWALSYGQKRLLALASVLVLGPQILLLDDPCAGLDLENRSVMLSILEEEMHDRGMTVVWAAHELPFGHSPDRHVHIHGGRLESVQ